jgi:hypothetical protein
MTFGLTIRCNKPTVASGEWPPSGLLTSQWKWKMEPTARIPLASPVYETDSLLLTYAGLNPRLALCRWARPSLAGLRIGRSGGTSPRPRPPAEGRMEGAAGAAPAVAVLRTAAFADSPHAR